MGQWLSSKITIHFAKNATLWARDLLLDSLSRVARAKYQEQNETFGMEWKKERREKKERERKRKGLNSDIRSASATTFLQQLRPQPFPPPRLFSLSLFFYLCMYNIQDHVLSSSISVNAYVWARPPGDPANKKGQKRPVKSAVTVSLLLLLLAFFWELSRGRGGIN